MDINDYRKMIIEGKTVTDEQLRDAIEQIRQDRLEGAKKTTKKRVETKGMSDAELDADLADIGL